MKKIDGQWVEYLDADQQCKLEIWEPAGSVVFEVSYGIFWRDTTAALICFDLRDRLSFEGCKSWSDEVDTKK